jgi:hypothetical protein
MIIPKGIEKYLLRDEIIEKEFRLGGSLGLTDYKAYASNKRLFIKHGNTIRDVDYQHISSIELKSERSPAAVIIGLLMMAGGVIAMYFGLWGWWVAALIGLGAILLAFGLIKTESIEMTVVGLALPLKLMGHRSQLDSLFRLVREKRI